MLLSVDTSTRYAGAALYDDGRVVSSRSWYSAVNHTVELMPAVAQILQSRGLSPKDLEGIAIALGPGGFSALRVGMSVVKGLAKTAEKPVVGVGTLELEAWPYLGSGVQVCALLDSGRSEVASALFTSGGQRIRNDSVGPLDEVLDSIDSKTLFCGEGVTTRRGLIQDRLGPSGLVVHFSAASRLWALCHEGWNRLVAGNTEDLATLQPAYLRMPSVGGPKRRDWTPQRS